MQAELMAFADRFFAATLDAAKVLARAQDTPEGRYTAAGARLVGLLVTTDIAASPNPGAALLDMTVFVTLKRTVWERHWIPELYGEAGLPVLEALRELEEDIWGIASSIYSEEQLDALRALIDNWSARHPDTVAVDFVRLDELGDSRVVQSLMDAGRPGGMLAPVVEANRNLEEMRLLGERLVFLATRMQLLVSLQVEMASAKLAVTPEVRQLLEDSTTFAEASDRAAAAFAALAAELPEERRAAIDQLLGGLREERERIFAELAGENGALRPTLGDLRLTLDSGRALGEELDEVIDGWDTLLTHLDSRPRRNRPFDLVEVHQALAEANVTVREVQEVLASVEQILESDALGRQIEPIVLTAKRLEDEVVDQILLHAFLYGVSLMVVFFVMLTVHRRLVRREQPGREPGNEAPR